MVRAGRPDRCGLLALVALLALPLGGAGCARFIASRDLAPSGLTRTEDGIRRLLSAGNAEAALADLTAGGLVAPGDALLRALYQGITAHYAGEYKASNAAFEESIDLVEERYATRLSRAALALVTNDRALPYDARLSERLLIHYYGALNYLHLGNVESAAVEARRLSHLLERSQGDSRDLARTRDFQFLRLFAGTVFEAAGEWNDAGVAYRNAGDLAALAETAEIDGSASGEVIVILERGFVAHRVEQTVVIPLASKEVELLAEGQPAERLAAAGLVAARVLAASMVPQDGIYQGNRPRPVQVQAERRSEVAYLLRLSWPVLFREARPAPLVEVKAGGYSEPVSFVADVSAAVARDMEAERSAMLARAIARSAAKLALSRGVEERLSEKNEGTGRLAGLLTNLGGVLLEQADTRSWHLLPAEFGFSRFRLPAGPQQLSLQVTALPGYPSGNLDLGEVDVQPGGLTIIATRIWR